ncbi:MAG: hypothetical protein JWN52_4496 [Actinomycetia bacterium]|nr:hypothetical protein [Actinomycetes bacterium]
MTRKVDEMKVLTALRPADARSRTDPARLAEILATPRSRTDARWTAKRRIPVLRLTAGLAAAGVAAGVAVAVVGTSPGGQQVSGHGGTTAQQSLDARTILLASATVAERAPSSSGKYWYTSERDTRKVQFLSRKGFGRSPGRTRVPVPFEAYVVSTLETWEGLTTSRAAGNPKLKIIFSSAADEAKWKSLGSPALVHGPAKPFISNNNFGGLGAQIGNHKLNAHAVAALPTNAAGVEVLLRRLYASDSPAQDGSFAEYVWGAAGPLLAGPITPGARAALFRVLAKQPGITARPAVDLLGRKGVGLTYQWIISPLKGDKGIPGHPGGSTSTLIIDPGTARLLEHHFASDGSPPATLVAETYQSMGWTDHLGTPASS